MGRGAESLVRHLGILRPAARRDRTCDHRRRHGRHHHGAWRDGDARRLFDLCRAEPSAAFVAELVARLRHSARVCRRRPCRHCDRASRDPLSLHPPARDAARHMGRVAHPATVGAEPVRRRQPPGEQSSVHVWRLRTRRPVDHHQPALDHRPIGGRLHWPADRSARDAFRSADARRDAEPPHGGVDGHLDGAGRHAGLRAGIGGSGDCRRGAVANRQRLAEPWPRLHHRQFHGRRVWRRRKLMGHRVRRPPDRTRQQAARAADRRRSGPDRPPGLHHPVHSETAARALCSARTGGGSVSARLDQLGLVFIAVLIVAAILVPVLSLGVSANSPFYLPPYLVQLLGKYLCYAILAVALDLVWGYCGILSLGHGAFFALGGYAMGMYLMRKIGTRGFYANPILPDFMVFLNWKELPVAWWGFNWFPYAMLMVVLVPGLLALAFGWFAFRSRVTGVYLSIITQAMTFALFKEFFRNDFGFGGNNGLTDFKDLLGFSLQSASTKAALFSASAIVLILAYVASRAIIGSKYGKALVAVRDAESRMRFLGYRVANYKLFVFVVSAIIAGIAGALYVPQVGIINPSEFAPGNSIEAAIWVAVGGRGTLIGAAIGAIAVNFAKTFFTGAFPEYWLYGLGLLFVLTTLFLPKGLLGLALEGGERKPRQVVPVDAIEEGVEP